MMRIGSPSEASNEQDVGDIQAIIAKSEKGLEVRTGLISRNKLDSLCKGSKSNQIFSGADKEVFKKLAAYKILDKT